MPAICMAPAVMTAWTAVARKIGGIGQPPAASFFTMRTSMPALRRRGAADDVVHEAAHEEDAAAAGLQDVLGRQRVGDLLGLEAFALVGDLTTSSVGIGRPA